MRIAKKSDINETLLYIPYEAEYCSEFRDLTNFMAGCEAPQQSIADINGEMSLIQKINSELWIQNI